MSPSTLTPRSSAGALILAIATLCACGGGPTIGETQPSGAGTGIDVRVSAGAPVAGAMVTVYAVDDAGEQNTMSGDRGVLGRGGPTDADGRALVTASVPGYTGPIQVVAAGPGLSYVDPTTPPPNDGSAPRVVQIPATFSMSSYVAEYRTGTPVIVPVTLLTTLADHAALAYARGRHPASPQSTTLRTALAARDELFVKHVTLSSSAWSPTSLRATVPAPLTKAPQTLVDTAYAALTDVALNQLARDVAFRAGYGIDAQNAVNAITLVQLLNQDLDADGRLDGRAEGGRAIAVTGTPAVGVDSHFLRKSLAQALDGWVRNRAVNKSGISTADLAAAQVYTRLSTDTSDLFDDAVVEPFDPIDRDPPLLSLADGGPPQVIYSRTSSVTLRVHAEDRSGVRAVYAQAGGAKYGGAAQPDGTWTIEVTSLPAVGHNPIVVWAEDSAEPASNSGFGSAVRQLTLDVLYDPGAPVVSYDSEFSSYADERGMRVATDANGRAVMPASYVLARPKTSVPRDGDIYKAATRLAGGTLDVGELETTNRANIPVLRFAIGFNPDTDSPIVQASYSVAVSCAGCAPLPSTSGTLVGSPSAAASARLYDLPLSTETVPALRSIVGVGSVAVTIDARDAAGNATTAGPFAFKFHVVGPPVALAEDASYPTYDDQWSTHRYTLANGKYAHLWDASVFPDRGVRIVRYVITNPAPEPVALSAAFRQAPGGSWKAVESWPAYTFQEPGGQYLDDFNSGAPFTLDGFTYFQYLKWAYPYGNAGAGIVAPYGETSSWPCGGITYEQGGTPAHRMGDTANRFVCAPPGVQYWVRDTDIETAVFAAGDILAEVYGEYYPNGAENQRPVLDATAQMAIVPAAQGGNPGTTVVYLTRSPWAARSRALEWAKATGSARYETWDWQVWNRYYKWTYYRYPASYDYHTFMAWRRGRYLSAASETIDGTLDLTTRGVANGVLLGEPLGIFSLQQSRTTATH